MRRYVIRRLLSLGLSLLVASALIFSVVELVPGDPASFMLGTGAQPDTVAALRHELGLDQPLPLRYAHWLGGVLTGDLGQSFTYKTPVAGMILDRIQVSLPLALMALMLAMAIAFPIGMFAAARRGRAGDTLVMGATQIGISLPNFWFAMLLVLVFAVRLRLLPAGGFPGWDHPGAAFRALILPAIALALPQAAILARVLRSALIETLGQDYIRTARAKGLREKVVVYSHAWRNALLPVITVLIGWFISIFSGSVIIENTFSMNGMGKLYWAGLSNLDFELVLAIQMFYTIVALVGSLIMDISYGLVDPRVRVDK